MSDLPIFPLPETVVFPGMSVPLFVFEERYKRLVRACLEMEQGQFVLSLAQANGVGDRPPFHRVGSCVNVLEVSENPDGTYGIFTHVQSRCKLEPSRQEDVSEQDGSVRPLFFSKVQPFPLERGDINLERVAAWDAMDVFKDYAKTFFTGEAAQQIEQAMPDDLLYQSSFICANLRIPVDLRQSLLEAPSLAQRFELAQQMMQERLESHAPPTKI